MDSKLQGLLQIASWETQRAAESGLTADALSAARSWERAAQYGAEQAVVPPDSLALIYRQTGQTMGAYAELARDAGAMARALDHFESAIALAGDERRRHIRLDVLQAVERLAALGDDRELATAGIEAARSILDESAEDESLRLRAVSAIAEHRVELLDPDRDVELLRRLSATLARAAESEAGPLAGSIAAMRTVVAINLARGGDPDAAQASAAYAEQALDYPQSPLFLYTAATAYRLSYEQTMRLDELNRAISNYEVAEAQIRDAGHDADLITADLLQVLLMRAVRENDPADWTRIAEVLGPYEAQQAPNPRLAHVVGLVNLRRYEGGAGVEELERARTRFADAAARTVDPNDAVDTLVSLGAVFQYLYEEKGELAYLRDAREAGERALENASGSLRGDALSNVAAMYTREFELTHDERSLDRAIELQREAVSAPGAVAPTARRRMNLGIALLTAARDLDRATLDEAITVLGAAAEAPSTSRGEQGDRLVNLGWALLVRSWRTGRPADRDSALETFRQALQLQGASTHRAAPTHLGLAEVLARAPDAEAEATEEFEHACELARASDPRQRLMAADAWATWAEHRSAFHDAARAYTHALEALQEAYDRQLVRADQELRLEEARDLSRRAAFGYVRTGDMRRAVMALEHGRALWLADALRRRDLDRRLATDEARAPVERLRAAIRRVEALKGATDEDGGTEKLRQAVREVEDATRDLRRLPAYNDALKPAEWGAVAEVAAASPIAYIVPGEPDGMALLVDGDHDEPTVIALPGLSNAGLDSDLSSYLEYFRDDPEGGDEERWPDVLDATCAWAWTRVMSPLLAGAGAVSHLTLVPYGILSLVPLHAAWTPMRDRASGRRYVCDEVVIRYTPNALALRSAERATGPLDRTRALVVVVPDLDGERPLGYASLEPAAVAALARPTIVATPEATVERVVADLPKYDVVHFACHAAAQVLDPGSSALVLDADEELRLERILALEHVDARLVVLSACETAVPGIRLLDEAMALSAGFLKAGASGIISSLWQVRDDSTLALMIALYRELAGGLDPPAALNAAHRFVRELDADRWEALTTELFGSAVPLAPDAGQHPFASPDSWAAFVAVGA